MPPRLPLVDLADWVQRALDGRDRTLLGIAGPPGSGKSSVAASLADHFGAPIVAMDGFHFAHEVVEANGWVDRKGAPHTFDAAGFVSLLRRLASLTRGQTAYAPRYDRALRQPIGSAVRVAHDDRLVIVEGNYLLLEDRPWLEVRSTLDTCVYLEMDDTRRVDGLVERHIRFGKDPATARRFVMKSDEANALVVAATRNRADLIVEV